MESQEIHKPLRSVKPTFCESPSYLTSLYDSEGPMQSKEDLAILNWSVSASDPRNRTEMLSVKELRSMSGEYLGQRLGLANL